MNKLLKNFLVTICLIVGLATFAAAQGGCINFPTPGEYKGNPNATNVYRVASGINATGAPVTPATISTDSTLATTVTQPVAVPQFDQPLTICAPAGPYTLQFNTSNGGGGFFNYNFIIPADATKTVASVFTVVDGTDNTKTLVFQTSGATTATKMTIASAQTVARTLTLPDATAGLPAAYSCGSTGTGNQTCTPAAVNVLTKLFVGQSTLSSNAATITFAQGGFTSTTSFFCVANDVTTRANPVQMVPASATTATITNTTGASDVIQWICAGQ